MKKDKPVEFTSIQVEMPVWQAFRSYARLRGFALNQATKRALLRWVATGCDEDVEEFKANKKSLVDDLIKSVS